MLRAIFLSTCLILLRLFQRVFAPAVALAVYVIFAAQLDTPLVAFTLFKIADEIGYTNTLSQLQTYGVD